MPKKTYTLTLDKELVDKVKIKLASIGGKLSTLLNQLLNKWDKENDNSN